VLPANLAREIRGLLETLRELAQGRYACLLEPGRTLFESEAPGQPDLAELRRFLETRRAALFALPAWLATEGPGEDVFDGWDRDEFFLAIVNGRVALLIACPEAEPMRRKAARALRALVDRLLRYDRSYRIDPRGRGLFLGRPRLDIVVVGGADGPRD
jgi:hypothetical protein